VTVLVIGDALLDVRVAPRESIRPGSDVPARIALGPGGQGANVAVRLARQGVPVELIAALGPDPGGMILRDALRAEDIRLHAVPVESTGAVVVLGDAGGERTMLSQRPAFAHLVAPALLTGASWVVVSGYLLHEPEAAGLAEALAQEIDLRVLLGCAVPDALVDPWRSAATALRPELTVLNRDEVRRLASARSGGVAVTDAGGATVSIAGVTVESRTAAAAPARDTTGAGDAFAAGLIAGLQDAPWPPERERMQDAVEAAVALAGRVARVAGAQTRVAGERAARLPR